MSKKPPRSAPSSPAEDPSPASFNLIASRQFPDWLREQKLSIVFTTYQTGKLFFVGLDEASGRLKFFERTFPRPMGLATDGAQTLWMSSLYQMWRFESALPAGTRTSEGHDAVYVPQLGYTTGDLDIHDIVLPDAGAPVFVNTLFSCLASPSESHSFRPIWKPPFITKLAAEDRCHLNGLALRDGEPRYVTMVAQTDVNEGWREHRQQGGVVMDVKTGDVVAEGLSMPHSPRFYRDTLYLINSGTGEFGRVDLDAGKFEPMAFCPGYARGIALAGDFAVIGLSECRENRTFSDLPLSASLEKKKIQPRCGLQVIDLRTGDVVHTLTSEGEVVKELYDVAVLPGIRRPCALGFKTDEIRRTITVQD